MTCTNTSIGLHLTLNATVMILACLFHYIPIGSFRNVLRRIQRFAWKSVVMLSYCMVWLTKNNKYLYLSLMWYATSYQFSMCLVRYLWLSMKVILYRRHGVWNYWNTDCLFNSTAWESNKLSPLLAPCEGNPPDTDRVPSQRPINSFPPSAAYMPQWTGSAVVQIMACRLSGAEPLHEAMLTYCQLDP